MKTVGSSSKSMDRNRIEFRFARILQNGGPVLGSRMGQYTFTHLALHSCNDLPQEIELMIDRIGPRALGSQRDHQLRGTLQRSAHGSKGPLGQHQRCRVRRGKSRHLQHRSSQESLLRKAPELLGSCHGREKKKRRVRMAS